MLKKSHLPSGISRKDTLCTRSIFYLKSGQCVLFSSVFLVSPLSKNCRTGKRRLVFAFVRDKVAYEGGRPGGAFMGELE